MIADVPSYDAFLSHNSKDQRAVELVAEKLKDAGLVPFIDRWNLAPGGKWLPELEEAIANSGCLIVLFGPSGNGPWQNEEMQLALSKAVRSDNDYRVIPVLLPEATASEVSGFIELRTWIDFRHGLDDKFETQRLIAAIKGVAPENDVDARLTLADEPRPFRGLERFESNHSGFFFGRDNEIRRLVSHLKLEKFVAIVGNSGCGKSSLVRSGLSTTIAESEWRDIGSWQRLIATPRSNPLVQVAACLVSHLSEVERVGLIDEFVQRMTESDEGLLSALATIFPAPEQPVLLLIDQFEEVFTSRHQHNIDGCRWHAKTASFANNLLSLVNDAPEWLRVIITLRADFVDRFVDSDITSFRQLIENHQFWIGQLGKDDLREIIVRPAANRGAFFEKGLVRRILSEMETSDASLPLLQETLDSMWDQRKGPWLTHDGYDEVGGVGGALAEKADRIYDSLTPDQAKVARRVFFKLVQFGEGVRNTRRRAKKSELGFGTDTTDDLEKVLQKFSAKRARLIRDGGQLDGEDTFEVTHEALLEHWPLLLEWLEEGRDDERLERRLENDARLWQKTKVELDDAAIGLLWQSPYLDLVQDYVNREGELSELSSSFFQASDNEAKERKRVAQAQRQQEIQDAKTRQALAEDARNKSKLINKILLAATLITLGLGLTAFWLYRGVAEQSKMRASAEVKNFIDADSRSAREIFKRIDFERTGVRSTIDQLWNDSEGSTNARMAITWAVAHNEVPNKLSQVLVDELRKAEPEEKLLLRDVILEHLPARKTLILDQLANGESKDLLSDWLFLAGTKPNGPLWTSEVADKIVEATLNGDPKDLQTWISGFEPAKNHLLAALSEKFVSGSNQERIFASSFLASYAKSSPKMLADLLTKSVPQQERILLKYGVSFDMKAELANEFSAHIQTTYTTSKNAGESEVLLAELNSLLPTNSQIVVHAKSGYALAIPFELRKEVVKTLQKNGFCPLTIRSYLDGNKNALAVTWRYSPKQEFEIEWGLSSKSLPSQHKEKQKKGFELVDVSTANNESESFNAIWYKNPADRRMTRVFIGKLTDFSKLKSEGFALINFSLVKANQDVAKIEICGVAGLRIPGGSQWRLGQSNVLEWNKDVAKTTCRLSICNIPIEILDEESVRKKYAEIIARYEAILVNKPKYADRIDTADVVEAYYYLGNYEKATKTPTTTLMSFYWQALAYAGLGSKDKCDELILKIAEELPKENSVYLHTMAAIHLGNIEGALKSLEDELDSEDVSLYYNASCCYARSVVLAPEDREYDKCLDRSIELLQLAFAKGPTGSFSASTDPDLTELGGDSRFKDLIRENHGRFLFLGADDSRYESRELHNQPTELHADEARLLVRSGYWPASISVDTSIPSKPVFTSSWMRELDYEKHEEALTLRARAAVLLWKICDESLQLVETLDEDNPWLRNITASELVTRVESQALAALMDLVDSADGLQAVLLAISERRRLNFPDGFTPEPSLVKRVQEIYQNHSDVGVHSACRYWLDSFEIEKGKTSKNYSDKSWYSTGDGTHTMAVIDKPGSFKMGLKWTMSEDFLHNRTIPRSYAISTNEVTYEQFSKFMEKHSQRLQFSKGLDSPVIDVTWYEAAAYCRWLSEQEGIPESEMCYPSVEAILKRRRYMALEDDFLNKTGYRLPTEAEWEYAAKSGDDLIYGYSNTPTLASLFSWNLRNSTDSASKCATMWPNRFGLFDVNGNVTEWCHDNHLAHPWTLQATTMDSSQRAGTVFLRSGGLAMADGAEAVAKGGSYRDEPDAAALGARYNRPRNQKFAYIGFRIARTMPEKTTKKQDD